MVRFDNTCFVEMFVGRLCIEVLRQCENNFASSKIVTTEVAVRDLK